METTELEMSFEPVSLTAVDGVLGLVIFALVAVATFRLCFLLSAPKRGGRRG